ncbi:unnamed protein product [Moneuplotes crassus]|uniref:PARP catalytic domain-containing protein n=1 Tax=Euplotes crassus TaxID=5936 RepID=A0AAD1Y0Z8_EUPCR|nr:unnamed protein product [Moneuplotes crassus]
MMREAIQEEFNSKVDICYDARGVRNHAIMIGFEPGVNHFRNTKIDRATVFLNKLIKHFHEPEEGDEFIFDKFFAEDDPMMRMIKVIAVEERKRKIQIEVELRYGVKIKNISFNDCNFICRIYGMNENIQEAKKGLEDLLKKTKNKLKYQYIPLELFKYCMEMSYFDDDQKWRENNTCIKRCEEIMEDDSLSKFPRAKLNKREICGSGISVNKMYNQLENERQSKNWNKQKFEDDLSFISDRIVFPNYYKNSMIQASPDFSQEKNIYDLKVPESASITEFFNIMKDIEDKVFPWLEIRFPDTWHKYSDHRKALKERITTLEDNPILADIKDLKSFKDIKKKINNEFKNDRMSLTNITSIHHVRNKYLFAVYQCCTEEKSKTLYDPHKENMLWHGTGGVNPTEILLSDEGIDRKYARPINKNAENEDEMVKYFGRGTYFALSSAYCDKDYAYKYGGSERQILFCRVYIGNYDFGLSALEPDSSRPLKKEDFSTVVAKAKALAKSSFGAYKNENKADIERKIRKEYGDNLDKHLFKEKVTRKLERDFFVEEINFNKKAEKLEAKAGRNKNVKARNAISYSINAANKMEASQRFDSIMDDRFLIEKTMSGSAPPSNPRMFVVFENCQVYPEFLVTYKHCGLLKDDEEQNNEVG